MYALFEDDRQIDDPFPAEKEVWEAALIEGLVTDVPVADEEGGELLPAAIRAGRWRLETRWPRPVEDVAKLKFCGIWFAKAAQVPSKMRKKQKIVLAAR